MIELIDDEAGTLADPDAPLEPLVMPRATNVVRPVWLSYDGADPACPERAFWLERVSTRLRPPERLGRPAPGFAMIAVCCRQRGTCVSRWTVGRA